MHTLKLSWVLPHHMAFFYHNHDCTLLKLPAYIFFLPCLKFKMLKGRKHVLFIPAFQELSMVPATFTTPVNMCYIDRI